jgi:hypothetical protein
MKTIKTSFLLLALCISAAAFGQSNPDLVIIRYASVSKWSANTVTPYFYVVNENGLIQSTEVKKENMENGETANLINKTLREYFANGYKLVSTNFSTESSGLVDKGEYILLKDKN